MGRSAGLVPVSYKLAVLDVNGRTTMTEYDNKGCERCLKNSPEKGKHVTSSSGTSSV